MTETLTPLFDKLADHLDHADRVLLLNPERGDPDSIGCTLALAHHLARQKKAYTVFSLNLSVTTLQFLPKFEEILSKRSELHLDQYDLIVTADFGDIEMTGINDALQRVDRRRCLLINIDHHIGNGLFGDLNILNTNSAAAAEIVFDLFTHLRWPLDHHIATCLLTSILFDTMNFSNPNTTPQSFAIAAQLLQNGARMHQATNFLLRNKSVTKLRLWGRALTRLQLNRDTGVASTYLTERDFSQCGADPYASEGLADYMNNLAGAKAVLIVKERGGNIIKGSLRTTGDEIDVAELARQYGGGGHRRSAGFTIQGKIQETNGSWQIDQLQKPPNQSTL